MSTVPMKIGSVEFLASELVDADYEDLEGFAQGRHLQVAMKAAKQLPKEDADMIKEQALLSVHQIQYGTPIFWDIIQNKEGAIRIGWQLIRKRHPNVPIEEFKRMFNSNSVESAEAVNTTWDFFSKKRLEANGGASTENGKSRQDGSNDASSGQG